MIHRITEAIKIAQSIEKGLQHFRLAAIAIREDGTKVSAINLPTKDPMARAHAENRVMRKAGYGAIVYVARVLNNDIPAMSKPCHNCEALMRARGVKKVYYSIDENEYGCLIF